MTDIRFPAAWLRSLAGLLALAGALVLSGCGGGGGAPSNAFDPFTIQNAAGGAAIDAYSGFPTSMIVSGGVSPYKAFSSNPTVLPIPDFNQYSPIVLLANNVAADTTVQVTVQDGMGRTVAASVRVHPAPMVNSLTITPNIANCGTNAICSGQTGTATVTLLGPGGGAASGRQVRFDVYQGSFGIVSTAPGTPIVSTLTVTSDSAGKATVVLRANNDAPTQMAQIRATDVQSGQQLTGAFIIQQITDGTGILSIVPPEATITAAYKGSCTTGFSVDYFIYGGTPPYRVSSTFPSAVTIVNSIVQASGQAFTAVTNGTCVDPLTFTIVDATGRQVTSTLVNKEGSTERPTVTPAALAVTPSSYTPAATCLNQSLGFIVTGGTTPYSGVATNSLVGNIPVTAVAATADPGDFLVGPLPAGASTTSIVFRDQSSPQKTITATITCAS